VRAKEENAMSRRALLLFVVAASLSLAACAGGTASTTPDGSKVHPAWLTGLWQATGWQVAGDTNQGQRDATVTFESDGTWKTSAGGSGKSWLEGDTVFIDGQTSDGYKFQVTLKQRQNADGSREMWGAVAARAGAAQLSLKQMR
jgi:hypothetical protein